LGHLVSDQFLFVEPVTQTLFNHAGIERQTAEHVVAGNVVLVVGEARSLRPDTVGRAGCVSCIDAGGHRQCSAAAVGNTGFIEGVWLSPRLPMTRVGSTAFVYWVGFVAGVETDAACVQEMG